jgi:hypothetical protein
MTSSDLEARLRACENRQAIIDLGLRYVRAYDEHDEELFLSIWAPDEEYHVPQVFGSYRGRAELLESFRSIVSVQSGANQGLFTPSATLNGDQAGARSVLLTEKSFVDGQKLTLWATYDDSYARIDGQWYRCTRVVTLDPVPQLPEELVTRS